MVRASVADYHLQTTVDETTLERAGGQMTEETITKADEGKRVLNSDGSEVGRLVDVENGRGYVEPDPGITETIKAKLGWGSRSESAHPLDEGSIEKITDDAVYLRGTL